MWQPIWRMAFVPHIPPDSSFLSGPAIMQFQSYKQIMADMYIKQGLIIGNYITYIVEFW